MCVSSSAPEAPLPVAPEAPPPPPKLKKKKENVDPTQKAGSGSGKGLSSLRIDRSSGNIGSSSGSTGLQIPRG